MEELTLIGNLGSDPDVRYTNGGEKVVSRHGAATGGKSRTRNLRTGTGTGK